MPPRIFLSAPDLTGRERELVAEAFASNYVAPVGPQIDAFEREFAAAVGVSSACALSSGTAGLHLALILAGVGRGDRVAVSTFTFIATANPVVYQGAEPLFIDSERETWGMDPARLDAALSAARAEGRPVKAVIVVHLYGQAVDVDGVLAVCERHGALLIEDAAESLGSTYRGRATGTFGHFGVFSFNGNKIITTSGGGMLVARDPAQVARAKFLSTQAKDPVGYYVHSEIGYNYRLSNISAAIGRGQLEQLEAKVARRRAIAARYERELGGLPGVSFMPEAPTGWANRWLSTMLLDPAEARTSRDAVVAALERENIECRPVWKPLHEQRAFAGAAYSGGTVSSELASRAMNLPSGTGMTEADQGRVIAALRGLLDR